MKLKFHKMLMVGALSASLISVSIGTEGAFASDGPPPAETATQRFEGLLQAIDVVPASAAALVASFPDIRARLAEASLDTTRDEWTRQRAISFLSFFPDVETSQVLVQLAADKTPSLRALAIYTLGRTFGPLTAVLPQTVVATLRQGLEDADVGVQQRTVRALRWVIDPKAEGLLDAAIKRQPLRSLATATLAKRATRIKHIRE